MQIANPLYDTVFKFLMEDTPSAILLLSTILDEPIISLDFLPQENTQILAQRSLTVYRLDFSAKVKTDNGYKQILIEIQKAKLPSDIRRFRRYLGEQYSKKSNCYSVIQEGSKQTKEQSKPLPLVTIYFLGYSLKHLKTPVVKVSRRYHDVVANQIINEKEDFIESLTHDSYIIQISQLRPVHQTEIEQLLAIFDQHQHLESDLHILDINEDDYSPKYRSLIRRLQQAIVEPKIRKSMETEDEILADLQGLEREIEETKQALQAKDQTLEKKNQVLEKQNFALKEKDQVLEKQNLALEEKDKLIAQLQQRLQKDS